MASGGGKWVRLSPARRLMVDLLRSWRSVPTVVAERRMHLEDLIAARQQLAARPPWSVILAKAFSLVAAGTPALRRSFIRFPWAHLYEHAQSVATIVVEREFQGEEVVFFARIREPHSLSLRELDAHVSRFKTAPVESVRSFRRSLQFGRLPRLVRRMFMWLGLHASGNWRERYFGTFALSSPASSGAGMVQLLSGLTATLHYGLFDEAGNLDMRLTFDHRVLDGAVAARALTAMEETLHGAILDELRNEASLGAAA